jgi:hypothetical protein
MASAWSLLMVIGEIVAPRIGQSPQSLDTLINPVLLALIILVIWLTAHRCGATSKQATLVSLCVAMARAWTWGRRKRPDEQAVATPQPVSATLADQPW